MNRRWLAIAIVAVLAVLVAAPIVILELRGPGAAQSASLASHSASPGFYALNLSDGSLMPLPAMGEFLIQG